MKKLFFVCAVFSGIFFASCGTKQVAQSGPTYTNPFAGGFNDVDSKLDVYDDDEFFAALGIAAGPSTQKGQLQIAALKNGQDIIAMKIKHVVEGELKSFFENIGTNVGTDYQNQTIGGINQIIMSIVNDTRECKRMFSGVDQKGNLECYMAIKVKKEKIANAAADQLTKSEKEEVRKLAEQFRKQLQEDLKRYKEDK